MVFYVSFKIFMEKGASDFPGEGVKEKNEFWSTSMCKGICK